MKKSKAAFLGDVRTYQPPAI